MMMQQQQMQQQDSYLSSRAEALHNVEATIVELGGIFTQLAEMVGLKPCCWAGLPFACITIHINMFT